MSFEERRERLRQHRTVQAIWHALVGLQILYSLWFIYRLVRYFMDAESEVFDPESESGTILAWTVTLTFLTFWIAVGVWRIERWVIIPILISFVGSLLTLNMMGIVITAAVGIGYQIVLAAAHPKKSKIPFKK